MQVSSTSTGPVYAAATSILAVLAYHFIHDSVHVNGGERLELVSLKESVKVRSPH